MSGETSTLEQQVENLQNEKKLFFDAAYRAYTTLAEVADETMDENARRKIHGAIEELGHMIGRTEPRERRREGN